MKVVSTREDLLNSGKMQSEHKESNKSGNGLKSGVMIKICIH
jgi:hypothetical protein